VIGSEPQPSPDPPGEIPAAPEPCVHHLFGRHARQTPAAVAAVSWSGESIRYGELAARAARLAGELRQRGVGWEVTVGIYLDHGLDLLVAVLGVLAAGGAYVPLDRRLPGERLAHIARDARLAAVVTRGALAARLAEMGMAAEPVDLEALPAPTAQEQAATPAGSLDPAWTEATAQPDSSLAYILYTSGSTGLPKGVLTPHRCLVEAYRSWESCYQLGSPIAVHAQIAAFSFAVFQADWIRALCSGGRLVLCPPEVLVEPAALYEVLQREGVELVEFVPAVLRPLLRHLRQTGGGLPALRSVVVGSDRWYVREHRELAAAIAPAARAIHSFGLTETTIDSAWFLGSQLALAPGGLTPIGRAFPHVQLYVTDGELRPLPPGEVGQLVIGGQGVTRGYLLQPALTAARFVPDALAGEPGARCYLTGDQARLLADGNVEFLGRADAQVKIRGFRVELGEIEAALERAEGVRAAVAALRGAAGGARSEGEEPTLVAYVVAEPGARLSGGALRSRLRAALPEYMIPSAFVQLAALPVTASGKVDRGGLPAPASATLVAEEGVVAPRDAVEGVVAAIWCQLLGRSQVSVEESFFHLGGHSLLAARAIARVRDAFAVELTVRDLFEAPAVAAFAARVRQARQRPAGSEARLEAVARDRRLPLSSAQQRLWFFEQVHPGTRTYTLAFQVPLAEGLDLAALARALAAVVARQESLRTTFEPAEDGLPVQRIGPPWLPVLEPLAAAAGLREIHPELPLDAALFAALLERALDQPFDLARGPLLRAYLARQAGAGRLLVLAMHHIICDAWSLAVLRHELAVLYEMDGQAGEPAGGRLPDLAVQYADYAVWQRQLLQGETLAAQLAYWKEHLAGLPPLLGLPADRPRPAVESHRGAVRMQLLAGEALGELLAVRHGITPYMALLAVFYALLHRLTGAADIAVGCAVANRPRPELEELIGFFANTLVLRGDLSGAPSLLRLLEHAREEVLAAFSYQDLPFERVVEELRPERSGAYHPLFQVMLVLQNAPRSASGAALGGTGEGTIAAAGASPPGLPAHALPGSSKFDLSVSAVETPHGLVLAWEYATDLFDDATIRRYSGYFHNLMTAAVSEPAAPVAALAILAAAEHRQLIAGWNDTARPFAAEITVDRAIDEMARRQPRAPALRDGGREIGYAELVARADELAGRLRRCGVGAESRVGLCLPRSLELVVGLLAVLKAGGAYVPLDPAYPAARLEHMLLDSGAQVLLLAAGEEDPLAGLPAVRRLRIARLGAGAEERPAGGPGEGIEEVPGEGILTLPGVGDPVGSARGGGPAAPPAAASAGGRSLAVVIYTSGSTGRPKGVGLEHRGLQALAAWSRRLFSNADLEGVLASTSICFDLSLYEILVTLMRGGRVILAANALALPELSARDEVTLINTVPAAMAELLHRQALPRRLRVVGLAGEPLGEELVGRLQSAGVRRLFNLYGPTETTVYSTWEEVPWARAADSGRGPAIGRPLDNDRVYLLDALGAPVPLGVVGEIHIGGVGVARGYLGRAELTAERFVPDSFAAPGERRYRTGDLARQRADGRLEFLGRVDQQVKVRGFRIELGEVETALRELPGVREAAVAVRPAGQGGAAQLVAYLVTAEEPAPAVRELRRHLEQRLPQFMVPALFVAMAALPRTPNGKLDRAALPQPGGVFRAGDEESLVPPRSAAELLVATIWSELLGVERIGVDDNFFELGGHSLVGARVLARLHEMGGAALSMRDVFDAPTLRALAARVEAAGGDAARAALFAPIRRTERDRRLPLSWAQQGLWLAEQMSPGSPAYTLSAHLPLPAGCDLAVLEQALAALVRRHEILRTTFAAEDGQPFQRIGPAWNPRVTPLGEPAAEDPAAAAAGEARAVDAPRPRQADDPLAAEIGRSFDLEHGPLVRFRLAAAAAGGPDAATLANGADDPDPTPPRGAWLVVLLHHLVADGWSLGVLRHDLAALHAALAAGRPSPLPDLEVQYADYAVWVRQGLSPTVLAAQLAYWRELLAGAPALLDLPLDRPRPPQASFRGATRLTLLPAPLGEALRECAARAMATPFMALLAAFYVLLQRLTGVSDLLVGTPVANRPRPELEGLIGFFANTLVLRGDLAGEPTFGALLGRVRELTLGALAHQSLPFEQLVAELKPQRSASFHPLFQVMFTLQGEAIGAEGAEGAQGEAVPPLALPREPLRRWHQFELTLNLAPTPHGLVAAWEYATDLFDDATIVRFAGHFATLLAAAVAAPEAEIAALPLLSEAERRELLAGPNRTELPASGPAMVHELVDAVAMARGDAAALLWDGGALSYAELRRRSNGLAHRLRALGVGAESRVGICCRRSPEMVVGLFAVLKAGGAFVPLDPGYPPARLALMLRDCGAALLLRGPGAAEIELAPSCPVVPLDLLAAPAAEAPPAAGVGPDNLAYVIYTSGTTGGPKGAMLTHRGARNVALAETALLAPDPAERVLQLASFSFDAAFFEILLALSAGAALGLADADQLLPGPALERQLDRLAVTTLVITPSALAVLSPAAGPALRRVVVVGEAFPPALAAVWAPRVELWNLYGPTEATIWATAARLDGERHGPRPPIGFPVANTRAHVVDARGEPVPQGVAGEIVLGGAGIGRGYLGRPELTAERFVPDPWSERPGERLYRTADLGRYLADGALDFLGRRDGQTKLRGYRIELGEIESALVRHPLVREAAVAVRDDEPGGKRLVAYLVAAPGGELAPEDALASLRQILPEYMVPAACLLLPELPRTAAGKLDRARLPAPERVLQAAGEDLDCGPRTAIEETLIAIWEEVLGRRGVRRGSSFFEIGGHSLLAGQVFARVWEAFEVAMSMAALFRAPVLADFAAAVEDALRAGQHGGGAAGGAGETGAGASRIPLLPRVREADGGGEAGAGAAAGSAGAVPAGAGGPAASFTAPLSFAQIGLWFAARLQPEASSNNMFTTLRLPPEAEPSVLRRALEEIVRRHEVLRTSFAEEGGIPVQRVEPAAPVRLEITDLRGAGEEEAPAAAREQERRAMTWAFDLRRAPLLRAVLVRLPGGSHLLHLTLHHIVSDGWSMGVMLRELRLIYAALAQGMPPPLAPLPVQYADYAAWQRRREAELGPHLEYWRRRLAGAPVRFELPFARPRQGMGDLPPAGAGVIAFGCGRELSAALRALARQRKLTLFMVLLTGFEAVLHRATGATDLLVATDVANRERRETEEMIGLFLNQVVLRADLSGHPSFALLCERVRREALAAFAHQQLPFELLVRELRPERDPAWPPLAQIKLNLQNLPFVVRQGSGLDDALAERGGAASAGDAAAERDEEAVEVLPASPIPAHLDLTVFLSDEPAGLRCTFVYNAAVYAEEPMRALAESLRTVLREMVSDPEAPAGGKRPQPPTEGRPEGPAEGGEVQA
jgi:amino acid adenylation domain-containing protein